MSKVLVPIADGSEEMEAVISIDVLRRAGAEVHVASVMPDEKKVKASRDVRIEADCMISGCANEDWDLIALPGGMPGAEHLQHNNVLVSLLKSQMDAMRWVAAICAAPAVVLGRNGLIRDYKVTCHPNFQKELGVYVKQPVNETVVIYRNLVSSQGAGTAMQYALTLVSLLYDDEKARDVAQGLVTDWPQ